MIDIYIEKNSVRVHTNLQKKKILDKNCRISEMETRESTSALVVPVGIQPRNVFGLRTDVKGNVNFTSKQEVIYPVAGVLAIQDFAANRQKFLRFAEYSQPTVITMSPNRKLLAVGEKFEKYFLSNVWSCCT